MLARLLLPQTENPGKILTQQPDDSLAGDRDVHRAQAALRLSRPVYALLRHRDQEGVAMVEIALAIAACGAMAKIADADGRSSIVWGIIKFVICAASFAIPLPFLRVLLAFIVAFIVMMVAKVRSGR
jgi:hypothetical protein